MSLPSIHRTWAAPGIFLFILPFTHTVALRLTTLAIALVTAIWLWRKEERPLPRFRCTLPLAVLIVIAGLSLLWTVDPGYSGKELKNELGYTMAALFSFYVLTRTGAELRTALRILLAGFLVMSAIALANYLIHGSWYSEGYQGGVGSYSTYLLLVLPMLGLLFTWEKKWRWLLLYIVPTFLATAWLTHNRMIWISLAVMGLAAFLLHSGRRPSTRNRWLTAAMLIATAAILAFVSTLQRVGPEQYSSEAGMSARYRAGVGFLSHDPRLIIWPRALHEIAASPLKGHGFGRRTWYMSNPDIKSEGLIWHAHNLFLNYGVQMGIPGMLALLAVFGCLLGCYLRLFRHGDEQLRRIGLTGILVIAGLVSKSMTDDLFVRDIALLFWAIHGILLGYGNRRLRELAESAVKVVEGRSPTSR